MDDNNVTIVMYHYIRNLKESDFPRIKARSVVDFENQLKYFRKSYSVISIHELLAAIRKEQPLPNNSLLLTFDDGYIDHYINVLPLLIKYNMSGCFYPCGKAIDNNIVLDVNKIHFIIASMLSPVALRNEIFTMLDEYRAEYSLESNEYYYNNLCIPNKYDTGDIIFIKRLLQRELRYEVRTRIISSLFTKYVTSDEKGFSEQLYLNADNLNEIISEGMHVGIHGYNHFWLNTLSPEDQQKEITQSIQFLNSIGGKYNDLTICYPYGAIDESVLRIVENMLFGCGFIVDGRVADISYDHKYKLPRMDTNMIPISC